MAGPERIVEEMTALVRRVASEAERKRKRLKRFAIKLVKVWAMLMFASTAIVVGMIASGRLFGPHGNEGVFTTLIALFLSWTAIIYWSFRTRVAPRVLVTADIALLPARTEEWLEQERDALPADARRPLDSILSRLAALTPQVQGLAPNTPAANEVRRLIGEELPELVRGYQRVPPALKRLPLHGGPSPDRQLVEGLTTIDQQLARMHTTLAADDLHALATQQRYLEMKYKGEPHDK